MSAGDPSRPAAARPTTPFTLLGDADGARCEDGVCAVPEPEDEAAES